MGQRQEARLGLVACRPVRVVGAGEEEGNWADWMRRWWAGPKGRRRWAWRNKRKRIFLLLIQGI